MTKRKPPIVVLSVAGSWIVLLLACQLMNPEEITEATSTPDLTRTAIVDERAAEWADEYSGPSLTLTSTPKPKPTATLDVAATQTREKIIADIQGYVDKGYIASSDGDLYTLNVHSEELAKKNYFSFSDTGYEGVVENFIFSGEVAWVSAGLVNYPEYSGCGFAYRVNSGVGFYTALLTNDSVYMSYCDESTKKCGRLGTTKGTGKLDFDNPAEAHMTLVVSEDSAYVMVDGDFIGQYTLFKDKLREPGAVMYGLISGTNRDYGVRCEITDPTLWIVNP